MTRSLYYTLLAVALVAAGYAAYSLGVAMRPPPELGGTALNAPLDVSHLELVAAGDRPVTLGELGTGGLTAVFFGFTRCPDVCPLTMARLAEAYRALGEPADLNIVLITVDPGYDTPDITDDYARRFHQDFTGLSGSNQQIAAAAAAFFVGYNDTNLGVIHTEAVLLMDADARFRRVFPADAVVNIEEDLARILAGAAW